MIQLLLLAIVFAVLNRVRGADILPKFHLNIIAKILCGTIFGYLVFVNSGSPFALPICIGLYFVGEVPAWGKWVGCLIDKEPRADDDYPKNGVGHVIHLIANLIIPNNKNHTLYSTLALTLRGIWWWGFLVVYAVLRCDLS